MYSLSVSGLTLVQQLLTCLANCTDQADCTIVLHDHAGENCLMYTTAGCGFPKNGDTRKFDGLYLKIFDLLLSQLIN